MSGSIAHVGPNLPLALLRATGRYRGMVRFDPDAPTPTADRWLESKFAPWARSILQAWASGAYDHLEAVLFSRADDSAQRLYYYLCELQRRELVAGPEPLILDIAKVPRASSIARTEFALRRLGDRLGVDEGALGAALAQDVGSGTGSHLGADDAASCLLAGTPPPDRRLHDAIARAGLAAVGSTLEEAWNAPLEPIEGAGSLPFERLARRLHAMPGGPRSFADPGEALRSAIATVRPAAVVLWQIEEDEAQAWHLPAQRRALDDSGVPSLVLTRRDWLARDGACDEIRAFLEECRR